MDLIHYLLYCIQGMMTECNANQKTHFVFLDTGDGVDMTQCSNQQNCKNGKWFHNACVDLDESPPGDWWCSLNCKASKSSVFCTCRKVCLCTFCITPIYMVKTWHIM